MGRDEGVTVCSMALSVELNGLDEMIMMDVFDSCQENDEGCGSLVSSSASTHFLRKL